MPQRTGGSTWFSATPTRPWHNHLLAASSFLPSAPRSATYNKRLHTTDRMQRGDLYSQTTQPNGPHSRVVHTYTDNDNLIGSPYALAKSETEKKGKCITSSALRCENVVVESLSVCVCVCVGKSPARPRNTARAQSIFKQATLSRLIRSAPPARLTLFPITISIVRTLAQSGDLQCTLSLSLPSEAPKQGPR